MILAVITIVICILFMLIFALTDKKEKDKASKSTKALSVQELINVADIKGHVLYTNDNKCISYVRIQPPMLSLWTKGEKRLKTNTLMAEISKLRCDWSITAVSRPLDVSHLVNQYSELRDSTDDPIRKTILKQESQELQNKVGAGEAIERQFYLKFWADYTEGVEQELYERGKQFISCFKSIGVISDLIKEGDIIRFCNLVHNPAYITDDITDVDVSMPMIMEEETGMSEAHT